MMFKPAIQKATLTCLALAVSGQSALAQISDASSMTQAAASRMSTSLSAMPEFSAPEAGRKPAAPPAAARVVATEASSDNRFDLSVKNAPASQVYLQLGMGSRYNVLVPQDLDGRVTLNLKNITLIEALDTLRDLYGYDYRIAGNRVFVSGNTTQLRLFRINYLPGRRVGSSELSISSTSSSTSSSSGSGSSSSASGSADKGSAGGGGSEGKSGGNVTSSVATSTDTDFWRDVRLSLESLVGTEKGRSVTINAAAGVIVVRATPLELRQVADYLRAVQLTIERQVMLEAKIVEVSLTKNSEAGINWSLFRNYSNGSRKVSVGSVAPGVKLGHTGEMVDGNVAIEPGVSLTTQAMGKGFYGLAVQGANIAALLNFLETQGDVQVLSSPRIAALNNQKAVLKVGRDETFVTEVASNTTSSTTSTTSSPSVKTGSFFSGISLDVTPQIDENGSVMLHVHPKISSVSQKDLSVTIENKVSTFPGVAVSVNETDSMVRVADGQIVALGGLMEMEGSDGQSGVPGLSRAPVVGRLFKYKTSSSYKRELVILIKPTVLQGDGSGADAGLPQMGLLDAGKAKGE
ncbi:MAG: pilus (MSHA type) biogenesis protein MshL [Aquabacterium sp.]